MQRHPSFDLWLHDDAELAVVLGSPIVRRATLHEWPLSRVERVACADGQTFIYKVQAQPTVEPEFYRQAQSPLLPKARLVPCPAAPHAPPALLLEFVQAPRLCDAPISPERGLVIIGEVLDQIGQIGGTLPALGDVRSPALWDAAVQFILADLRTLVEGGVLPKLTSALADELAECSQSAATREALAAQMGFVHFDLRADNVLLAADGFRVLDWQRPMWGPVALDRATLLESLGVDPAPHVPPGVLAMRRILLIGWFAQQACRWFPPGADWFASEIVREASQLRASAR